MKSFLTLLFSVAAISASAPAQASSCVFVNNLTRDSDDVVSWALQDCFAHHHCKVSRDGSSIEMENLSEGVSTIRFAFRRAADGSGQIIGYGRPEFDSAPKNVIFMAKGIPANLSFAQVLERAYRDQIPAGCVWQ